VGQCFDLVAERWKEGRFLCVGLDTDYAKIAGRFPGETVSSAIFRFNREIIEATAEWVCAFKPNSAFYEGQGLAGMEALIATNRFLRDRFPQIPIILDAKRADIGNTNFGYVRSAFEVFLAHAITVHPYLGGEAVAPFLKNRDRDAFVLCHTSNPGAAEFQELTVAGKELYKIVAERVRRDWNANQNCGLVVGATYPGQLAEVRKIAADMPFLIPGIGAQGGDLELTVRHGLNAAKTGIIINASRSVLYADLQGDYAAAAAAEAARLHREIGTVVAAC
jgi:orotidine-5'-phosphate decarboxylase